MAKIYDRRRYNLKNPKAIIPFKFNSTRSKQVRAKSGIYGMCPEDRMLRDKQVERIIKRMREVCPFLQDSDLGTMRQWARLEIIIATAFGILRQDGLTVATKDGNVDAKRFMTETRRWMDSQLNFSRELGLTPAARMAISANGTDAALDVATLMSGTDEDPATKNGAASRDDEEIVP